MSDETRIDTFCGTCVFAEYDDDKKQVGCAANVLQRIQNQGKETTLEILDDHQCHKLIGYVCPFWRPQEWAAARFDEDTTVDVMIQAARQEMTLRGDIIIYCGIDSSLEKLAKTIESIRQMSLKPTRIYLANDHMDRPSVFFKWANENVSDMPWRIESIITSYEDKLRAIDAVSDKCTGMFISVFAAGFEIPADFLSSIDTALYDNLSQFVYLSPADDLNGLTFMRQLHLTLAGNKYGPILEQVKELCEQQNCPNMIKTVAEIVPSMSA